MTAPSEPVFALKTLLLCDLVESTGVIQRLGDRDAAGLFRRHDRLARSLLGSHRGQEIDKSDGFLILFDLPSDAIDYALEYIGQLSALESGGVTLRARVGIHVGEVILMPNDPEPIARGAKPVEVEGLAKVIAARLMTLAQDHQILVSRSAYDLAQSSRALPANRWHRHGEYMLKGLCDPIEVYEVASDDEAPFVLPRGRGDEAVLLDRGRPTIVVLAFLDQSAAREHAHIGQGLCEDILTGLSRMPGLHVMARSVSAHFERDDADVRSLGRKINVRYIVEGTVQVQGDKLRVTAMLVDAISAQLVWSERYTTGREDLFEVEERISRRIVSELQGQLDPVPSFLPRAVQRESFHAYEYYALARQEVVKFTADALQRALGYLQLGLRNEPNSVLLTAALGYAHWQHVNAGVSADRRHLENASACADRVLAWDPESVHGHRLRGLVDGTIKNVASGMMHLERALDVEPYDPDALLWLTLIYGFAGRAAAAEPLVRRLLSIDPLTPFYQMLPGFVALMGGDLEGALQPFEKSRRLDPGNPIVSLTYAQILAMNGDVTGALAVFDELAGSMPKDFFGHLAQLYACCLRGQPEVVASLMTPELVASAACDVQYSWSVAECMAMIGDVEAALHWLRLSVKLGFWNYRMLFEYDPFLAELRDRPEFAELLRETTQLLTGLTRPLTKLQATTH